MSDYQRDPRYGDDNEVLAWSAREQFVSGLPEQERRTRTLEERVATLERTVADLRNTLVVVLDLCEEFGRRTSHWRREGEQR